MSHAFTVHMDSGQEWNLHADTAEQVTALVESFRGNPNVGTITYKGISDLIISHAHITAIEVHPS